MKVQKALADKEAEMAKIKEERDTLSDQKTRIVQNAGKKIKKLQAELAEANAKLGNDTPKKEPVAKAPVPGNLKIWKSALEDYLSSIFPG